MHPPCLAESVKRPVNFTSVFLFLHINTKKQTCKMQQLFTVAWKNKVMVSERTLPE